MSEIKQVTDWIDAAGQEPSVRNVALYFGMMLEEIAEGLNAVERDDMFLENAADFITNIALSLKSGDYDGDFDVANKRELLDSAIDTAWVALGAAHMLGDAQGAFAEVVASNYSKMQDGVLVKDATGKVVKGPSYFKPDLAKYLR